VRFKVNRTRDLDEAIYEFIENQKQEKKLPIWKLVPGAEDEKLPFG
jgi:hypothetical protein